MWKSLLTGLIAGFIMQASNAASTPPTVDESIPESVPDDITQIIEHMSEEELAFEDDTDQTGKTTFFSLCKDTDNLFGVAPVDAAEEICIVLNKTSDEVIDKTEYSVVVQTNEDIGQIMPMFLTPASDNESGNTLTHSYNGTWHNATNNLCYTSYKQADPRHYCVKPKPVVDTTMPPGKQDHGYRDAGVVASIFIIIILLTTGAIEYYTKIFSTCMHAYCCEW